MIAQVGLIVGVIVGCGVLIPQQGDAVFVAIGVQAGVAVGVAVGVQVGLAVGVIVGVGLVAGVGDGFRFPIWSAIKIPYIA